MADTWAKRGRKRPTAGNYVTREKLVEVVLFMHYETPATYQVIANHCDISHHTAAKIVKDYPYDGPQICGDERRILEDEVDEKIGFT